VSLESWRKARRWKDPAPPAPKSEPAPEPEPEMEMSDEERAFDHGNTGPVDLAEQEDMERRERNPGGFMLAKMIVNSMNDYDKNRRAR
jgi:hypothetical protein